MIRDFDTKTNINNLFAQINIECSIPAFGELTVLHLDYSGGPAHAVVLVLAVDG